MAAFSDDPPQRFEHRIRWGNVALALAALAAIVAALTLPRGEAPPPIARPVVVAPTAPVSGATGAIERKHHARSHRHARRKMNRRQHVRRHKAGRGSTAARSTAAPAPNTQPVVPAPAPVMSNPTPAAEREFGL
jgi:hypothetical protein